MLHRAKSFGQGAAGERQIPEVDHRVQSIIRALDKAPSRSIQDLARMVNLSSSRLSHLFKNATGSSLQAVLCNARLQAAAGMLESTHMPVKEISYSVGYRHSPSFVRAFRKRYGYSPNDYRNQQRAALNNSRFS